jgi:hypothetical protein
MNRRSILQEKKEKGIQSIFDMCMTQRFPEKIAVALQLTDVVENKLLRENLLKQIASQCETEADFTAVYKKLDQMRDRKELVDESIEQQLRVQGKGVTLANLSLKSESITLAIDAKDSFQSGVRMGSSEDISINEYMQIFTYLIDCGDFIDAIEFVVNMEEPIVQKKLLVKLRESIIIPFIDDGKNKNAITTILDSIIRIQQTNIKDELLLAVISPLWKMGDQATSVDFTNMISNCEKRANGLKILFLTSQICDASDCESYIEIYNEIEDEAERRELLKEFLNT